MQAIEAYTTALKAQAVDPSVLLSNRCAAYCRLSEQLRNIPAAVSEAPGSALFGQDPMSHVQVGQHHEGNYLISDHSYGKSIYLAFCNSGMNFHLICSLAFFLVQAQIRGGFFQQSASVN
jgi:hypothetical protein